mmetsp:Transcript_23615/g.62246  ORF Transcript_23615/g.62246 Transcript_23615/m.62246 type:complete len:172 (+) Transcript_23615:225-740(+)
MGDVGFDGLGFEDDLSDLGDKSWRFGGDRGNTGGDRGNTTDAGFEDDLCAPGLPGVFDRLGLTGRTRLGLTGVVFDLLSRRRGLRAAGNEHCLFIRVGGSPPLGEILARRTGLGNDLRPRMRDSSPTKPSDGLRASVGESTPKSYGTSVLTSRGVGCMVLALSLFVGLFDP